VQRAWRSDQYRNWWLEEKATRELAEARAQAEQQRREAADARVRELEEERRAMKESAKPAALAPQERGGEPQAGGKEER
jgi:hypothetical protein